MRYFRTFASLLSAFWISLLAGAAPAHAEITITQAEYAAGVLVVRGETSRRNQRVTLDGRYKTRTDRFKEFRFRIRYLPSDCSISIRAGQQVRPVGVTNCGTRPSVAPGISNHSAGQSRPGGQMRGPSVLPQKQ